MDADCLHFVIAALLDARKKITSSIIVVILV